MSEETFKNFPKDGPQNWTEDYMHENGMYQNRCLECKELFFGHKRRVICKTCFNKPPDWEAMAKKEPPKEIKNNAWPGCWADGEMAGFARCMVKEVKPLQTELKSLRDQLAEKEERHKKSTASYIEMQNTLDNQTQVVNNLVNDLAAERHKVEDLKKALKDVLPIAENHASILRIDEEYSGDDMGYKESQQLIDKAKNLLK
jgi:hypothetical protein